MFLIVVQLVKNAFDRKEYDNGKIYRQINHT